ncbi:MAG: helix-turn-helix transcriptional regulator [Clostridiales bacterium]|nr:helix-turn-helix transcriptional regulator [Clostridiales bacterium]
MKKIREYRLRANLSQGQLAEKVNVKQPSVSQWERGTAYPAIDTAKKLCEVLQIPFNMIFDHYSGEGPFDIPVYSGIRGSGEPIPCTRAESSLRISEDELRRLVPKSEISERGLSQDPQSKIDPGWFFGYYCESENLSPMILPHTINLIYRTGNLHSNSIHLVSMDGRDGTLVRLIQNEQGILAVIKGISDRYRYFRPNELKSGALVIYGIVVESRKTLLK